jgi:hypothetical protein
MKKRIIQAALIVAAALAVAGPSVAGDGEFNTTWHDGRAELSGYTLKVSRYGEERQGTCVLIYVDDFSPVKVTFSSAEWCGHVYEDLIVRGDKITGHYYSYFENESRAVKVDVRDNGMIEDNLLILLRGLRADYLEAGASREIMLFPSSFFRRLSHTQPQWVRAMVSRRNSFERVTVPAGGFDVMVYEVNTHDGREGVFYIEKEYPHRIVQWSMFPDIEAQMTGSERLPYWSLNDNGNESYLTRLGLPSD